MIYLTRENYLLCETLSFLQKRFNGSSDDNDKEKKVLFQVSQILENIPTLINHEIIVENIDIKRSLLNTVILQEVFFLLIISILTQLNTHITFKYNHKKKCRYINSIIVNSKTIK